MTETVPLKIECKEDYPYTTENTQLIHQYLFETSIESQSVSMMIRKGSFKKNQEEMEEYTLETCSRVKFHKTHFQSIVSVLLKKYISEGYDIHLSFGDILYRNFHNLDLQDRGYEVCIEYIEAFFNRLIEI